MLNLPGEPCRSCRSPFRDEKTPSFSIHSEGKAWTDHGTGEGGDVVEFIRHAIGGDHKAVREWLMERIGIDFHDAFPTPKSAAKQHEAKSISWPCKFVEGTPATWQAFAKQRGFTFPAVHTMVKAGILRFGIVDGAKCFIVTDDKQRAAEIRRIDGQPFGESKAYPLRGVDKSWMPGVAMLEGEAKKTGVILTEGATDLLAAIDLYSRYRRDHCGDKSWMPCALLGAKCRNLHADAAKIIRGRYVRIIPDADDAGDQMAEHWQELLRKHGCTVDIVDLPRGTDLSDNMNSINPIELFQ